MTALIDRRTRIDTLRWVETRENRYPDSLLSVHRRTDESKVFIGTNLSSFSPLLVPFKLHCMRRYTVSETS